MFEDSHDNIWVRAQSGGMNLGIPFINPKIAL